MKTSTHLHNLTISLLTDFANVFRIIFANKKPSIAVTNYPFNIRMG